MNRHWNNGFQTMITNDVYRVEDQLAAYDPYLYLMYNPNTGEHLVMDGLLEVAIMRIPQKGFPFMTSAVVDHIKRIHTANGFSAVAELEKSEAARAREFARKQQDLSDSLARDMQRAVKNHAYGYV